MHDIDSPDVVEGKGRLLKTILITLVIAILCLGVVSVFQPRTGIYLLFVGIAAGLSSISLLLAAVGRYRISALVFCVTIWTLLTVVAILTGGTESPAYFGFIFVVVFAGIFLGGIGAYSFALAGSLCGLALAMISESGGLPPMISQNPPIAQWAALLVYLTLSALAVHIAARSLSHASMRHLSSDRELSVRAERLALVNRIGRAVAGVLDLDGLLETVYREIDSVFTSDAFYIALYDREKEELDFRIRIDKGRREEPYRRPVGVGLSAYVVQSRTPLLIRDYQRERETLPRPGVWGTRKEASSWLGVPILLGEREIGLMSIQSYTPGTYDESDTLLLSTIADQIAVAIENARLYGEVRSELAMRKDLEQQLVHSQKMEAVGRLAGGVAHDFNNYLTGILGYTELAIGESDGNEELKAELTEIKNAVMKASGLTRQLLAFSRKQILNPVVLDLNTVIVEMKNILERIIGEGILVEMALEPDLLAVKADPGQMQQVVMNLAVNARDAMAGVGTLTLATTNIELDTPSADAPTSIPPGRYVRLEVSDTGTGMEKEILDHVFDPFYTTKESGKGTGLGLATVHGIVNQSGGEILVSSIPGRGTTFHIYLPTVDGP